MKPLQLPLNPLAAYVLCLSIGGSEEKPSAALRVLEDHLRVTLILFSRLNKFGPLILPLILPLCVLNFVMPVFQGHSKFL